MGSKSSAISTHQTSSDTDHGHDSDHIDIEKNSGEWEKYKGCPGEISTIVTTNSLPGKISSNNDPTGIPDGGLRAWGVVFGAMLAQFCSSGYVCSFGVFQDYYTRVYMTAHSPSDISWIGSVNTFLILGAGLVAGRLYDKGYFIALLYGGSFLMSLSLFLLSLAKPNQLGVVLVLQGIGVGVGGGMIYVPSFAIVSQYFDKRRDMVLPLVATGVSLAATLNPIMINNLLQERNLGFALVTKIHAAFMSGLLVIICLLVRPRVPPAKQQASVVECLKRFAKDKAYVIMTLGFWLFGLGLFFPIFFLQLAATTHGLSDGFAFYSLVLLNGCSCVARIISAAIAHKTRPDYMAIGSAFVCGGIVFAFLAIGSAASVLLVAVIYGLAFGILVATMAPLASLLTDNPAELGLRLGNAFSWTGFGELIGPPIMGALLKGYHWWRPALFSALLLLSAGCCFVAVSVIYRGRKTV